MFIFMAFSSIIVRGGVGIDEYRERQFDADARGHRVSSCAHICAAAQLGI